MHDGFQFAENYCTNSYVLIPGMQFIAGSYVSNRGSQVDQKAACRAAVSHEADETCNTGGFHVGFIKQFPAWSTCCAVALT
jgi:hypothetical protein